LADDGAVSYAASDTEGPESGLDRLDSVSVRVDELVKDQRPPKAAALRAVLDKVINTNNLHPSDQGRTPDQSARRIAARAEMVSSRQLPD
jgi:hypothetical protein